MNFSFLKIQKIIYYFLFLSFSPFYNKSNDPEITITSTIGNIIDLGTNYIITKIEETKKTNSNDYNYLFGIFEASQIYLFQMDFQ
jgi:hypothetical protein